MGRKKRFISKGDSLKYSVVIHEAEGGQQRREFQLVSGSLEKEDDDVLSGAIPSEMKRDGMESKEEDDDWSGEDDDEFDEEDRNNPYLVTDPIEMGPNSFYISAFADDELISNVPDGEEFKDDGDTHAFFGGEDDDVVVDGEEDGEECAMPDDFVTMAGGEAKGEKEEEEEEEEEGGKEMEEEKGETSRGEIGHDLEHGPRDGGDGKDLAMKELNAKFDKMLDEDFRDEDIGELEDDDRVLGHFDAIEDFEEIIDDDFVDFLEKPGKLPKHRHVEDIEVPVEKVMVCLIQLIPKKTKELCELCMFVSFFCSHVYEYEHICAI
jgi:hypothetical protein